MIRHLAGLRHAYIRGHWPVWGPPRAHTGRTVIRHCQMCAGVWIRKRQ